MGGDYSGKDGLYQRRADYIGGKMPKRTGGSLKPKDLIGMPWRLALALQQPDLICKGCSAVNHESRWGRFPNGRRICPACEKSKGAEIHTPGWWLRSDIIWHKPNPMPESVTDRPTKAHEHIFLLAKSAKYYYDADAVREDGRDWGTRDRSNWSARINAETYGQKPHNGCENGNFAETGRNKRDVWTIPTAPYPGAHYATFPPALPETCIKAGTSEKGCCPECGAPWERVVEQEYKNQSMSDSEKYNPEKPQFGTNVTYGRGEVSTKTIDWRPTCDHDADPVPCTVLDPFNGHGTTGLVAARLGRNYIGIEINPDDCKTSKKRIEDDNPLFNKVEIKGHDHTLP
jgi:hypothetical protein